MRPIPAWNLNSGKRAKDWWCATGGIDPLSFRNDADMLELESGTRRERRDFHLSSWRVFLCGVRRTLSPGARRPRYAPRARPEAKVLAGGPS